MEKPLFLIRAIREIRGLFHMAKKLRIFELARLVGSSKCNTLFQRRFPRGGNRLTFFAGRGGRREVCYR